MRSLPGHLPKGQSLSLYIRSKDSYGPQHILEPSFGICSSSKPPNMPSRSEALAMIVLTLSFAVVGIRSALAFTDTCYGPPYAGGGPEGPLASGDTPCTKSTDQNRARVCCGYYDGSICLSNGLCFVPQNNSMMQGSCTDPTWKSAECPNTGCVGMHRDLYITWWSLMSI